MALRFQILNVLAEENIQRCRSLLGNALAALKLSSKPESIPRRAAILIPLCMHNNKPSVLFARRPLWMRRHAGEIAFPGGAVDTKDDSLGAAALREAKEELGITLPQSSIIGALPMSFPNIDRTYFVTGILGYIGEIHRPDDHLLPETVGLSHELRPHRGEVDDIFIVSIEKLVAAEKTTKFVIKNSDYSSLKPGQRFWRTPCYRVKSTTPSPMSIQIWGLTALMLHQTLKILLPAFPNEWIVR